MVINAKTDSIDHKLYPFQITDYKKVRTSKMFVII